MNIDKIISKELHYNYLERVEASLHRKGLSFQDLRTFKRAGHFKDGRLDPLLKYMFRNETGRSKNETHCLCGHRILQQCYLCPEGSTNIDEIIVLGNHCITKWGYEAAIRGTGVKVNCEYCNSTVNKTGLRRHHKTNKCRNNRDTSSSISTSVGSDE